MTDLYDSLGEAAANSSVSELFRFRRADDPKTIQNLRDLVVHRKLWLSDPRNFNDPFDCYPGFEIAGTPFERRAWLTKEFHRYEPTLPRKLRRARAHEVSRLPREDVHDLLEAGLTRSLQSAHVLCLSADWSHPLMWSHYAKSHTGVCVGFRRLEGTVIGSARPLHYTKERAIIQVNIDDDRTKLANVMFVKSDLWSYEAEWRALSSQAGPEHSLRDGEISRIILGARIHPIFRKEVIKLCESAGVPVEQATFDRREWKLLIQDHRLHSEPQLWG